MGKMRKRKDKQIYTSIEINLSNAFLLAQQRWIGLIDVWIVFPCNTWAWFNQFCWAIDPLVWDGFGWTKLEHMSCRNREKSKSSRSCKKSLEEFVAYPSSVCMTKSVVVCEIPIVIPGPRRSFYSTFGGLNTSYCWFQTCWSKWNEATLVSCCDLVLQRGETGFTFCIGWWYFHLLEESDIYIYMLYIYHISVDSVE